MNIRLGNGNEAPIYQQIVDQVTYLVASGQMRSGEELEPIRSLAGRLVINPNTVARAYMELEREGVVVKRHGAGTYVADRPPAVGKRQQQEILAKRADALLVAAQQLGVPLEQVISLLEHRATKVAGL